METAQTDGAPPSLGRVSLANIGCTENRSRADRNSVAAKAARTTVPLPKTVRAGAGRRAAAETPLATPAARDPLRSMDAALKTIACTRRPVGCAAEVAC